MITLNVNGQNYQVTVSDTGTPLLWVLRDILGLTGTKYGCGKEICGACTVLVDGRSSSSCQMDVSSAVGHAITTIEGWRITDCRPIPSARRGWARNSRLPGWISRCRNAVTASQGGSWRRRIS